MPRKLFEGAFGLAAGAVRHVAWYLSHRIQGHPRTRS
jgi:hypothetical protein